MNISAAVADMAADLAALGDLGDEAVAAAARKLAAAMEGPMTARLLEILGQVAAELNATQPRGRVEVRLVGGDVELVLADTEASPDTAPAEPEGDVDARITLRLSSQLKTRIEAASTREGVSVNTWIVRALGQYARPSSGFKGGRRLTGYGRT
jgi:HicB-like protein involved in pilus formation